MCALLWCDLNLMCDFCFAPVFSADISQTYSCQKDIEIAATYMYFK